MVAGMERTRSVAHVHVVRRGESLWSIAQDHLTDATRWQDVYRVNRRVIGANPDHIVPGMRLGMPGGSSGAAQYVVRRDDSLWTIAARELGDASRWRELYALNRKAVGSDPSYLLPGTVLRLPHGRSPKPTQVAVRQDDSLWTIAARELGDGSRWRELYALNRKAIGSNPNYLLPGTVLRLP